MKKLIKPIISCATGLLGLIFLALDYFSMHMEAFGQSASQSLATGYRFAFFGNGALLEYFLDDDGTKLTFFAYIASIALILLLVASIVLLLTGAAKILRELKVFEVPGIDLCKLEKIGNLTFCGTSVIALVCALIFGFANGESVVSYMPAAGAWLLVILAVAEIIAVKVIDKKAVATPAVEEQAKNDSAEQ